jgi:hypothetical protein
MKLMGAGEPGRGVTCRTTGVVVAAIAAASAVERSMAWETQDDKGMPTEGG